MVAVAEGVAAGGEDFAAGEAVADWVEALGFLDETVNG
jgi:hypothetical protein